MVFRNKKIGREGGKKSKHFSLLLLSLPTHPLELGEPQMGHKSEFLNTEPISDGDIKLRLHNWNTIQVKGSPSHMLVFRVGSRVV